MSGGKIACEESDLSGAEGSVHCSRGRPPGEALTGHIVFTEDSFEEAYPPESRTYVVSSSNKAFRPEMGGCSLFGSSLDGTDQGVRLDYYMTDEHGSRGGWKVEACYLVEAGA